MNILITGGAGFIGSHLVDGLISQGHKVTIFDNFSTGNLSKVKVSYIKGDVSLKQDINKLSKYSFDAVYHLAGLLDVKASILDPNFYTQTNVIGTTNMLEFCRKNKIKKFIYASSCASEKPLSSPYALTKYLPEYYCNMYRDLYNIDTLNVRFYNVYGEGMNTSGYRLVLSIFLEKYHKGLPLPIVGDGEQTRDFIYVGDIISGLIKALRPNNTSINTINLGTGNTISINEIIKMFSSNTVTLPERDEPKHIEPADISQAKNLLGWRPEMKLVDWVKNQIK